MDISLAVFVPFGAPDAPLSAKAAHALAREVLDGYEDRCHAGGVHLEPLEPAPDVALSRRLVDDEVEVLVHQGPEGWLWHHDGFLHPIGSRGDLEPVLWDASALVRRSTSARLWRERVRLTVAERTPCHLFVGSVRALPAFAAAVCGARGIEVVP